MKTFVLFDIDGTLLFSNAIDSLCFADSYHAIFGHPFPTIDWRQFPQVTDHVIFRTAFYQHFKRFPSDAEREEFEDHYVNRLKLERQAQPEAFQEVSGAADCWHYLNQDDRFVTGIATGGWKAPAQIKLQHVGIPSPPPYAAYANDMEHRAHILESAMALARAEHAIDKVVYVGDAIWDVHTTRQMNIPLIGIRREGDHDILLQEGVPIVLSDYQDMDVFLKAIAQVSSL